MTVRLQPGSALCAALVLVVFLAHAGAGSAQTVGPIADVPSETGVTRIFSSAGPINLPHPFAQDFGTNGRMCVVCHMPTDGMSITPANVRARFDATNGFDPLFRTNDGSNSPLADVSTLAARRAAYSMLLARGVIRIELAPPPGAEFIVQAVEDPYGYANPTRLSLFRRPLPATNLAFATAVMWDGRETTDGGVRFDLLRQANDATVGHAQATQSLPAGQQGTIVDLEDTLFLAEASDASAGSLSADGATGGPEALSTQPFFPGINSGLTGSQNVFSLYQAWAGLPPSSDQVTQARRLIGAGEALFNNRDLGSGFKCSACHNTPNIGNQSVVTFFDTSVASAARRTPDMPLYTLFCPTTQRLVQTTDPGRAMVTGKCNDIQAFKVPTLRGIGARAPFFHDGSAATLRDVVLFYDTLFGSGLQPSEVDALVAFLRAL
jgi:cytochrome c peroxidase